MFALTLPQAAAALGPAEIKPCPDVPRLLLATTAYSPGYVTKTSLLFELKLTADPLLLDSKTVSLLRVVPLNVYVPIPTSQVPAAESTIA
jgi:hypothetical protein